MTAFAPARLVSLAVKHPYAIALYAPMTDRAEGTFALLRYSLGGDRPSQTTHHTLSPTRIYGPRLELRHYQGGISTLPPQELAPRFKGSHLSYTDRSRFSVKL